MHLNPINSSAVRDGLIDWLADPRFTHAVTLNSERELGKERARKILGTFCAVVDRTIFRRSNLAKFPRDSRFFAIAFPEHLESNAHFHLAADLSALTARRIDLDQAILAAWHKSCRTAGSVDVQSIYGKGWPDYITKAAQGTDPLFYLSTDFHPH